MGGSDVLWALTRARYRSCQGSRQREKRQRLAFLKNVTLFQHTLSGKDMARLVDALDGKELEDGGLITRRAPKDSFFTLKGWPPMAKSGKLGDMFGQRALL